MIISLLFLCFLYYYVFIYTEQEMIISPLLICLLCYHPTGNIRWDSFSYRSMRPLPPCMAVRISCSLTKF